MKRLLVIFLGIIVVASPVLPAFADSTPATKGLAVTPLRQSISLNAGTQKSASFTVSNLTGGTLTVQLSDKQFSVADYTYDYRFNVPQPNLVSLSQSNVILQPGHSQTVSYTVTAPANAAPGGQYYTLFASATLNSAGVQTTVQATTLLYVTVNGALVTTTRLQSSSLQHFVFGSQIAYQLNAKNTGNVHYFIYTSAQLHGLFVKQPSGETHLLLPGTVRTISGTIDSPLLPGIYKATYGYKTDSDQQIMRSGYVAYLPPWSIAFVLAAILLCVNLVHRHKKKPSAAAQNSGAAD